jgi:T-complex protein 1 subunit beta
MAIEINDILECELISLSTNSKILTNIPKNINQNIGNAKLVEEIIIGDSKMIKFSGVDDFYSLLLRGPNLILLDEYQRCFHDVISILTCAKKNNKIIGGGGASQFHIANKLRIYSQFQNHKIKLIIESFALSLEYLPFILSQNGNLFLFIN